MILRLRKLNGVIRNSIVKGHPQRRKIPFTRGRFARIGRFPGAAYPADHSAHSPRPQPATRHLHFRPGTALPEEPHRPKRAGFPARNQRGARPTTSRAPISSRIDRTGKSTAAGGSAATSEPTTAGGTAATGQLCRKRDSRHRQPTPPSRTRRYTSAAALRPARRPKDIAIEWLAPATVTG